MTLSATSQHAEGAGREPEHTHPATIHTHDHFHVTHVHVAGADPEWRHQANWHTHEHDHRMVVHSHDYAKDNEDQHHGRRAHVHDHEHPVHGAH